MIRLREVRCRYGRGRDILKACSLSVEPGQVVALAGPNGAGKTTLLKCASGLLAPCSGTVELGGRSIGAWPRVERAKRIGYVPQKPLVPSGWTVAEIVALGDFPYQEAPPAPSPLSERLSGAMLAMELEALWDRPAGTLSGGEVQRVVLARVFVQGTQALVMDEPASHLDPRHGIALFTFLRSLAAEGRSILLSTHDINLSRAFGQRLVLMDGGGHLHEMPEDIQGQRRLLERTFGVGFQPIEVDGSVYWMHAASREQDGMADTRESMTDQMGRSKE